MHFSAQKIAAVLRGLILVAVSVAAGCSGSAAAPTKTAGEQVAVVGIPPETVVEPGGRTTIGCQLKNPLPKEVEVAKWQSSCECVGVEGGPMKVAAKSEAPLKIKVDFAHDAKYAGSLEILIDGFDAAGRKVVSAGVPIEVRAADPKRKMN